MSIHPIYDRIRTVAHFYGISSLAHEPFQKVVPEWRPSQLFCVVHTILTGHFLDMNETLEGQWLRCMKLIPQIWTHGIVYLPAFEYVQCLCLSWLFPTTSSWGRCNRYVISFAAFFDFALGFCTLSRRSLLSPGAKRSHEYIVLLSRFMDTPLQTAFLLDRTCWHGVVTAWLNHILYLAWRPEGDNDDVGFTYLGGISCKHRCFYVGYCGLLRKNAQHRFGLFQRWFDHKVREARPKHGHEKRYKCWRNRAALHRNHLMPIFSSTKLDAWKREQFIIRSFTLPVQSWRKKSLEVPSRPQRTNRSVQRWNRQEISAEQACALNVTNMMLGCWHVETLDAVIACCESSHVWTKLSWSCMLRLGVSESPPLDEGSLHLWTCKIATRGTYIPWHDFTPNWLVKMRSLADHLQNPSRKGRAKQRLSCAMRKLDMQTLKPVWLSFPDATPAEASRAQKVLRAWLAWIAMASALHKSLVSFWRRNLYIVRGKPRTVVQCMCNHRQAAMLFDVGSFRDDLGVRGSLLFVDENLRVPMPTRSKRLIVEWAHRLYMWLLKSNLELDMAEEACNALAPEANEIPARHFDLFSFFHGSWTFCARRRGVQSYSGKPQIFAALSRWLRATAMPKRRLRSKRVARIISALRMCEVVAQQDKCPAAIVGMSRGLYYKMLFDNFMNDPKHYHVLTTVPQEIVERQFWSHLACCPRWARRRRSAWSCEALPRAYVNLKRKCFNADGLVCAKQHAHVREIISNFRAPLRRPLKILSRGIQCVLKNSGRENWEVWSLRDAPQQLRERVRELLSGTSVCRRCQARMPPVSSVTVDINQLYKDVSPTEVIKHYDEFQQSCCNTHLAEGVTVLQNKRYQAFVGGTPWTCRGTYLTMNDMKKFLQYYLQCNVFQVGVHWVQQTLGVPMGGGASKICASLILGGCEASWVEDVPRRTALGFGGSKCEFACMTTGCRYVDDACICSTAYCSDCLELMAQHVYHSPLVVERVYPISSELTAERDVVSYTHLWLDMRVTLGHSLNIQLHSKNAAALMGTGCLEHSTLPVFEAWDGPTKERAKWWLNARVHRISHINGCIESMLLVCKEMELFGYPARRVNRLASTLRQFRFVSRALQIRTSK